MRFAEILAIIYRKAAAAVVFPSSSCRMSAADNIICYIELVSYYYGSYILFFSSNSFVLLTSNRQYWPVKCTGTLMFITLSPRQYTSGLFKMIHSITDVNIFIDFRISVIWFWILKTFQIFIWWILYLCLIYITLLGEPIIATLVIQGKVSVFLE